MSFVFDLFLYCWVRVYASNISFERTRYLQFIRYGDMEHWRKSGRGFDLMLMPTKIQIPN